MPSWELVEHRRTGKNVCVVFIHGFAGNAAKTWENFPRFMTEDQRLTEWDILGFGYESDLAPDGAGMWSGVLVQRILGLSFSSIIPSIIDV